MIDARECFCRKVQKRTNSFKYLPIVTASLLQPLMVKTTTTGKKSVQSSTV
jgi:hypothetical protein